MSGQEIRMFNIERGRDGDITHAVLCNGRRHFGGPQGINSVWIYNDGNTNCDGGACQASGSEPVDTSLLTSASQEVLGLKAHVPPGMVLLIDGTIEIYRVRYSHAIESGALVTPRMLESGRFLAEGEGATTVSDCWGEFSSYKALYYVRNAGGKPFVKKVGKAGRKRTEKKLAKLRVGERKSEVSYEVSILNGRLLELMQLHRTPEVNEEIERVKGLLRLASSLSVEASIEAAESNEQIARELANARAREIGSETQLIRERLMLEQQVREAVKEELDRYDN
jgi:hypothetical protein